MCNSINNHIFLSAPATAKLLGGILNQRTLRFINRCVNSYEIWQNLQGKLRGNVFIPEIPHPLKPISGHRHVDAVVQTAKKYVRTSNGNISSCAKGKTIKCTEIQHRNYLTNINKTTLLLVFCVLSQTKF